VLHASSTRHFRLVRESEVADRRREHPPEQRIFVLPFGVSHSDLAPFLRSLAKGRGSSPIGSSSAPSRAPSTPVGNPRGTSVPTSTAAVPAADLETLLRERRSRLRRELATPGWAFTAVLLVAAAFLSYGNDWQVGLVVFLIGSIGSVRSAVSIWNRMGTCEAFLTWLRELPPTQIHAIPDSPVRRACETFLAENG